MEAGRLNIEQIMDGLTLRRVGRMRGGTPNVLLVDTVSSTNDLAWAQATAPDSDGCVVLAEQQTSGRGRLGRRWESPRGASLLCSVLLLEGPDRESPRGPRLALLAAVTAHDAIAATTGVQTRIKWPNDLFVGGRKLAGVLAESRTITFGSRSVNGVVVGVGINCLQQEGHFPPELRNRATSLELVAPVPVDRNALGRALLGGLDRWLAEPATWTADAVRQAWLDRAAPLGARIRLQHAGHVFSGHIVDLDPTASLLVQLDTGQRRLFEAATTTVLPDEP